jgi:hypothetical protein
MLAARAPTSGPLRECHPPAQRSIGMSDRSPAYLDERRILSRTYIYWGAPLISLRWISTGPNDIPVPCRSVSQGAGRWLVKPFLSVCA